LLHKPSDVQFERFCIRHYREVDGRRYVPTSYNYDRGRDARMEFEKSSEGTSYLCATTERKERDLFAKAEGDLTALLKGDPKPGFIRFCFSEEVTEGIRDNIIA